MNLLWLLNPNHCLKKRKPRKKTNFLKNKLGYSSISSWERQNPAFKEIVNLTITPLLISLSILNYVDMDSEAKVLGYGISLILLNVGMYFVAPVIVILKLRKCR